VLHRLGVPCPAAPREVTQLTQVHSDRAKRIAFFTQLPRRHDRVLCFAMRVEVDAVSPQLPAIRDLSTGLSLSISRRWASTDRCWSAVLTLTYPTTMAFPPLVELCALLGMIDEDDPLVDDHVNLTVGMPGLAAPTSQGLRP
jgi:hypothetical protein